MGDNIIYLKLIRAYIQRNMAKQQINPKLQTLNKKDCVGFLLSSYSLVSTWAFMATYSTENIKLINSFEARVHAATLASSHNIQYVGCRFSWLYVISFLKSGDSLETSFFLFPFSFSFLFFFFLFVLFCFAFFFGSFCFW